MTKTIFIGTSQEGTSSLIALHADPLFDVCGVITQPDKPTGRKKVLIPTPIKQTAENLEITVHTPDSSEDPIYEQILEEYNPELAITIAFGQFIPKSFLEFPTHRCLNVHYSLLPVLRGAVPVQKAILEGHEKTGVTVQIMEETMDTGPTLAQKTIKIEKRETTPTLKDKLITTGKDLLMETLPKWISGKITPKEQDPSEATYCYMNDISKENAYIDWKTTSPVRIDRMVRALLPWPVAWTTLQNGKRLKIFEAELAEEKHTYTPGTIIESSDRLLFATNNPNLVLNITSAQLEGKERMPGDVLKRGLNL